MRVENAEQTELLDLLSGDASALLDALMAYIPIGLTIAQTPDVRILRVSKAGAALLGTSPPHLEEISVEKHAEAFKVHDPQTGLLASPEHLPLTRATLAGETVVNEEWLLRSDNGREVTILCNAGPIRNQAGDVIGGLIAWADISEKKELEGQITAALATRDRLVAELYHRIANHLQIVSALVQADARDAADVDRLAQKVQERIAALGRAYSAFRGHQEDLSAAAFLNEICAPLQTATHTIEVQSQVGLEISAIHAPIVGIVVNEAVCNAIKHAYPQGERGCIAVSVKAEDGDNFVLIRDDGVGMTPSRARSGQGLRLMNALMEGIGGRVAIAASPGQGTKVTASWPSRENRRTA